MPCDKADANTAPGSPTLLTKHDDALLAAYVTGDVGGEQRVVMVGEEVGEPGRGVGVVAEGT